MHRTAQATITQPARNTNQKPVLGSSMDRHIVIGRRSLIDLSGCPGIVSYLFGVINPQLIMCILKAGCGKTVLWRVLKKPLIDPSSLIQCPLCSSSAIEDIECLCEEMPNVAVAYFFFDGRSGQVELASYEKMIRSLISQLLDQLDRIPKVLMQIYGKGHKQASVTSLKDALQTIMEEFDQTFIIIDALDECVQREKLLEWVKSLSLRGSRKIHFLLASRQEPDIKNHLKAIVSLMRVKFGQDTKNDDIHAYIKTKVSKMKWWNAGFRQTVTTTLLQDSGGMWVIMRRFKFQL